MQIISKLHAAAEPVLQLLSTYIGANTFFLASNEAGASHIVSALNRTETLVEEGTVRPLSTTYCHLAVRERKTVVIENTKQHPETCRLPMTETLGACSFVAVPIVLRSGQVSGTLCVMDRQYSCELEHLQLLEQMAKTLSTFIDLELSTLVDSTTGAYNRRILERLQGDQAPKLAAFVDVDHFKQINDMYGHQTGDQILRDIVSRTKGVLSGKDLIIRYGGDEFLLLLQNYELDEAMKVIDALNIALKQPYHIGTRKLQITVSIGVSDQYQGDIELDELIIRADQAMYHIKEHGKDGVNRFSEIHLEGRELELALKQAVEREEFVLHFQPVYRVLGEEIKAYEALIRWKHPERGLLYPGEFLPAATRFGLMYDIGEWMFRQVCGQVRSWEQDGLDLKQVFVNFSREELNNQFFMGMIKQIVAETGIDPKWVGIELSEHIGIDDLDYLGPVLSEANVLGFSVALDDFGAGRTSLKHLSLLPAKYIKIDMSLIRGIVTDRNCFVITSHLIAMAKDLGKTTIAEGVETLSQLTMLKELGCDFIQGYYFGRPAPL